MENSAASSIPKGDYIATSLALLVFFSFMIFILCANGIYLWSNIFFWIFAVIIVLSLWLLFYAIFNKNLVAQKKHSTEDKRKARLQAPAAIGLALTFILINVVDTELSGRLGLLVFSLTLTYIGYILKKDKTVFGARSTDVQDSMKVISIIFYVVGILSLIGNILLWII